MPTFETQQDFARRIGVVKSRVTKLRQDGRIVMHGKLVNAEASLELVRGSADPSRALHQAAPVDAEPANAIGYQLSRAMREQYMALEAKRVYEQACGKFVSAQDVAAASADAATIVRTRLENLPEQLVARLAAAFDEQQSRAVCTDLIEEILSTLSSEFGRIGRGAPRAAA